jgi:hypothetical protein
MDDERCERRRKKLRKAAELVTEMKLTFEAARGLHEISAAHGLSSRALAGMLVGITAKEVHPNTPSREVIADASECMRAFCRKWLSMYDKHRNEREVFAAVLLAISSLLLTSTMDAKSIQLLSDPNLAEVAGFTYGPDR